MESGSLYEPGTKREATSNDEEAADRKSENIQIIHHTYIEEVMCGNNTAEITYFK